MITLKQTCEACPEQYDAFIKGTVIQVGYLRLRHGRFRVSYPDVKGETIYSAEPNGDGAFDDDEREYYLEKAKLAIYERCKSDILGMFNRSTLL